MCGSLCTASACPQWFSTTGGTSLYGIPALRLCSPISTLFRPAVAISYGWSFWATNIGDCSVRIGRSGRARAFRRKVFNHPIVGPIGMDVQPFAVHDRPGLSLRTYSAATDRASQQALRSLSRVGESATRC
jgi:hypothetical protein